jgi:hypothetical protein
MSVAGLVGVTLEDGGVGRVIGGRDILRGFTLEVVDKGMLAEGLARITLDDGGVVGVRPLTKSEGRTSKGRN